MQAEPHWEMASNEGTELGAGSDRIGDDQRRSAKIGKDQPESAKDQRRSEKDQRRSARIAEDQPGMKEQDWPLASNEGTPLTGSSCNQDPTGRSIMQRERHWKVARDEGTRLETGQQ